MNKRYLLLLLVGLTACVFAKQVSQEIKGTALLNEEPLEKEVIQSVAHDQIDKKLAAPDQKEEEVDLSEVSESFESEKTQNMPDKKEAEQEIVKEPKEEVEPEPEEEIVNKIAIVVYTDEEPIMITQHTLNCKSLDGRSRDKKEVLMEHLMCYEALNYYRMPITDDMVDNHLASLKEMHGIGDSEIRKLFRESGYTYEEGREQLRASYAIQNLMGQLVDGRVVVTEKEIQAFYKKNPLKEQASYRIQTALIAEDELTDLQIQDLEATGRYKSLVTWNNPYWLDKDEIVDSKLFITSMKDGEINLEKTIGGTQAIMLLQSKNERIRPLDECRREITAMIRAPRRQEVFEKYEQELLTKYDIVYLG